MSEFDLEHLANNLSLNQGKEYIKQYFVPLTNGNHAVLSKGKYIILNDETVRKVYLNRMSKELSNFYTKEYYAIKSITYKLGEDVFIENQLNLCPQLMHTYQPFELFDESIKESMKMMLEFIKNVICGEKQDSYEFTLKWLSNMIRGNKNNSCLYLKDEAQGIGKSTLPLFIKKHVIGKELCLETGSRPLISNFNSILEGKLLVQFEELENFSSSQWMSISSTLKRIITSDTYLIEGKNINSYETQNINNYMLLSNNEAIKDDEGRRYFILDLSTNKKGDFKYFDLLHSTCFNDDVGHAFYCYMLEYDLTNYNSNKYPMTSSKLDSIAKRLQPVELFLKTEYVLRKKGINKIYVKDLHKEYEEFHRKESLPGKPFNKIDFNKKMTAITHREYIHTGKGNYYNISVQELFQISNKENWIHKIDEFEEDNNYSNNSELFTLTDNIELNKIKNKNEELQKENEELKKSLFELNLLLKEKEKEYDTEDTEDEIIIDEDVEVETPLESYSRDYDKDEEMEYIFNQLF